MRKKADHNILCPLFFLLKISEGKIGTANPQFFASVIRLDLAGLYNTIQPKCGLRIPNIQSWIEMYLEKFSLEL